jgi:hypothetical protein
MKKETFQEQKRCSLPLILRYFENKIKNYRNIWDTPLYTIVKSKN